MRAKIEGKRTPPLGRQTSHQEVAILPLGSTELGRFDKCARAVRGWEDWEQGRCKEEDRCQV